MKRLDRFILTSFVGPFVAILFIVIFILMMQFLWLYIDELVGKGLSLKVILEFLGWGSATLLPLSLPLATLLSSVMTLGNLGENNELLAIKAAGISLSRVLAPLIIVSAGISIGAFFAANDPRGRYSTPLQIGMLNVMRTVRRHGLGFAEADRLLNYRPRGVVFRLLASMIRGGCPFGVAEKAYLAVRKAYVLSV